MKNFAHFIYVVLLSIIIVLVLFSGVFIYLLFFPVLLFGKLSGKIEFISLGDFLKNFLSYIEKV